MHPLRILFISRWYPNKEDPMPGLFVQRHAQAVALQAEVSVLYVHPLNPSAQNLNPGFYREKKNGVTELAVYYRSISFHFPGVEIMKGLLYLYYMWKGYKILKKEKGPYHLIHVNILTRAAILPFLLNLFQGIPYIVTEHWSRYLPVVNTYEGSIRKWITRLIARRASALTAVTHNLKEAMQKHGIDNKIFEVIPNVVDTDFFTPDPEVPSDKVLLHVSCFEDRSKNISGLLQAVALLKEKRRDFKVLLVGEGQDLSLMMQMSNNLNLRDTVTFTGLAEGEQLLNFYKKSCCLVMFSNYENMPVVINESISCGKPVITTAVGGIPEIMNGQPEKGILIAPGDIAGLADAMNKMLDGFQQFDPDLLHRYAVEKFSKKAVCDAFLNLYNSCVNLQ